MYKCLILPNQRLFRHDDQLPEWLPKFYTKADPLNKSKGYAVQVFAKRFLKAVRGQAMGKPVSLQEWQKWLINNIMEVKPDGSLRYRNVTVMIPRKNGKTFLMGILLSYHLLTAPARAEIYSAASSREQAKLVFDLVAAWIEDSPILSDAFEVQKYKHTITNKSTGATYKALSADGKAAMGTGPYFMIAEEIHTWDGESLKSKDRGREQYNAYVKGSADQSSFQLVSISTAGSNVNDSLLGDLYRRGVETVQKGGYGNYGFFCWQADEADDPMDLATWRKANPSLIEGMLLKENVLEQLEMSTYIGFSTFLRDVLNIWVDIAGDPYIMPTLWKRQKLTTPSVLSQRGREVTIGFDASKRGDSTAIVIQDLKTGEIKIWKIWERPDDAPDDFLISREEVTQGMKEAVAFYKVRAIYCDSFYYESEIDTWIKQFGWNNVVKISQSNERKDKMATEFRQDLAEQEVWHSDGDDGALTRHISNVITTASGSFRKPSERRKIDAFVASMLANAARRFILENPLWGKKKAGRIHLSS